MTRLRSIHIAFLFFFLTALSGVYLRLQLFTGAEFGLEYGNLLHGHSHIAILGWTFFAVFLIFLFLTKEHTNKFVKVTIWLLLVVTVIMFIAFLIQGYALYSIIFSTLHIFLEYVVVFLIVRHVRKRKRKIPKSSRLFMYGAVIMLVISTVGPFALGGIASQGLRDSPIFDMAIYFYLHFQYNGWLYFMLIGMFLWMLAKKQIAFSETKMRLSFWVYFFSLFPSFFLSILWYGFGTYGTVLATIGALGLLTGVILFLWAMLEVNNKLRTLFPRIVLYLLYLVLLLVGVKGLMELGLLYRPFGELIYDTRSVVIGYLHLTLLGFVTIFILVQFFYVEILPPVNTFFTFSIGLFLIGFIINELVLFFAALFSWLHLGALPGQNLLLLFASFSLLIAVSCLWYLSTSYFEKVKLYKS